jgi:hypothetical protein
MHLVEVPIGPPLLQALRARLRAACAAPAAAYEAPVAAVVELLKLLLNILSWHEGAPSRWRRVKSSGYSSCSRESSKCGDASDAPKACRDSVEGDPSCSPSSTMIHAEVGGGQTIGCDTSGIFDRPDECSKTQHNVASSHGAPSVGSRASSCGSEEDFLGRVSLGEGFWDGAGGLLTDLDNGRKSFAECPTFLALLETAHSDLAAFLEGQTTSEPGAAHSD